MKRAQLTQGNPVRCAQIMKKDLFGIEMLLWQIGEDVGKAIVIQANMLKMNTSTRQLLCEIGHPIRNAWDMLNLDTSASEN